MDNEISKFYKYANKYKKYGKLIDLKIDHTIRVMNLCGEIAESLDLDKEDIKLAKICGLVHDIARFEQLKRYNTFSDLLSIDHGNLGVEILQENNFIREFNSNSKNDGLILKTVKNHNKYELEKDLNKRETLFCNIVRDADKIDILYLYTTGEITLNLDEGDFSDLVYNELLNKHLISRKEKINKNDSLGISLGFVYDLNFRKSFEILKENDYLNKEIDIYIKKSNNKSFKEHLENIRNVINSYIEEMIVC